MISRWMYALVFAVLMNAQPASLDDMASERALSRFMAICDAEGKALWGRSLCGPIAIVNPETRWTIANEQDPENKFTKSGGVYSGLLPAKFATANTAFDWGNRKWTMVMSPLPSIPIRRWP